MKVTRKGFIASVGPALVAAVALPSSRVFADALTPRTGTGAAGFAEHVGSSFELTRADGTRAAIVLRDVVARESHPGTEQFSLMFTTSHGAVPPQGTYAMRHAALGSLAMFLAPLGGARSNGLRADFNRLKA